MRKRIQAVIEDASLEASLFLLGEREGRVKHQWEDAAPEEENCERLGQKLVRICNDFVPLERHSHHDDLCIGRDSLFQDLIRRENLHEVEAIERLTTVGRYVRNARYRRKI